MKDYASMSDFEVNKMVSAYLWGSVCAVDGVVLHGEMGGPFDPCNNPADAWPILLENHIAIAPYKNATPCAWPSAEGLISKHVTEDANPLRAGMVTFLKMKEGE